MTIHRYAHEYSNSSGPNPNVPVVNTYDQTKPASKRKPQPERKPLPGCPCAQCIHS